jgi:prepilin-type N-terminal cleavage/methylation domain-containing protein/prepilin-type processing-associated H-X9-DG protein
MNRNGFSLVELLVIIAIIALISSITLPVLRQSRNQGQQICCASNVRQISMAAAIYGQENKTFPQGFCDLPGYDGTPPTGMHGDASFDWQGWWWFDFMADSLSGSAAGGPIWCPSRKISRGLDTDHVLCGNYGINTSICRIASLVTETEFLGTPLKSNQILAPSSTLLIVDSGYSLISWKALCPDSSSYKFEALSRQNIYYLPGAGVNQDRTIHPDHINDAIGGRHPKQILNVGYADGHVDNKKQEKLCPGFDEQGKPTNYSTWSTFKNR